VAQIVFTPPQTVADFMVSDAFFRLIAGPVGSAKTTGCIFELYRRAAEQRPAPDGFRYTRFAIIRQTLQQLKQTILKDVLQWLPGLAMWKVSESTIHIRVGDIISEWILIPLENIEDQRRLLSSQLTGAWISECIEIDVDLVPSIAGRCGRYPNAAMGGCTWQGIIADTNFPEEGSGWHEFMEVNVPADWQVFKQPGGLSEHAENLEWLNQSLETLALPVDDPRRRAQGRLYYERLARNPSPAWVRRYVHAQYGIDPSGTAVFASTFRRDWHVRPVLQPIPGRLIIIGQDFGRDPCSLLMQLNMVGQLQVLQEVVADDIGLQLHIQQNLRPAIADPRYLGCPIVVIGDPAGAAKDSLYEVTSFDLLRASGFTAFPAPTNDLDTRLRAVEYWLMLSSAGGPGMLIDGSRCPVLVKALNGGYKFEKDKTGEAKAKPHKGNYSHIADALQYGSMGAQGGTLSMINRRIMPRASGHGQRISAAGWT
jgi:hypothetical protein